MELEDYSKLKAVFKDGTFRYVNKEELSAILLTEEFDYVLFYNSKGQLCKLDIYGMTLVLENMMQTLTD